MVTFNVIILVGDNNLYINDTDDPDTCMFLDTINAKDLRQHVNFPTHRGRNILSQTTAASCSKIKIVNTIQGPYIFDHCIIQSRNKEARNTKNAKLLLIN